MVLKDDLDEYYKAIEKNLENTDAMDLYATVWHDDPCIYYLVKVKIEKCIMFYILISI